MAVRIFCSACNTVMHLADELRGKKIRCKSCGSVVDVPQAAALPVAAPATLAAPRAGEYAERSRMPAPPMPPRRRPTEEEDEDRRAPRRRRKKEKSGMGLLPLWIGGGVALLVGLIVTVVVLIVSSNRSDRPAQAQNNAPAQPQVNAAPAQQPGAGQQPDAPAAQPNGAVVQQTTDVPPKRNAPPLLADPAPGETLKGEQIYQRLLQSTVWIVASHKIVANNNNRPLAQIIDPPQPGFQQPPGFPQIPKPGFPQFPKPGMPNFPGIKPPGGPNMDLLPPSNQKSTLQGSVWTGNETLAGFGGLQFQFITNTSVVMVDSQETSRGNYRHNGNSVTITFSGGVVYNGTLNGNSLSGTATNGRNNWNWNVSKGGGSGPAPGNPGGPGGGIVAKSSGSGSLIDRKHRLIVTNVHVVGNCDTVAIYFPDFDAQGELVVHSDAYKQKAGLTGRVVMREERADIALVQLAALPEGVQPLALSKTKARAAQQVHSVGNPGASKGLWIYSPGKVRQVYKDQWKIFDDLDGKTHNYDAMKIETDSPINPGDSGGPLVDDRAAMVGVAHGGSLAANNISHFIEVSEVRQLLERYYRSVNDTFTANEGPPRQAIAAK